MADEFGDTFGDTFGSTSTAPTTGTIAVEVAWDKTVYTDETGYVRPGFGAVTASYGRDQSTALAPTVSGTASFVLDNRTGRFSPRNAPGTGTPTAWTWSLTAGLANTPAATTGSPLYGNLKPARPVRISRTIATGTSDAYTDAYSDSYSSAADTTFVLFDGHTDDTPINPDLDNKTVSVSAVDWLADFRDLDISTGLYSGIRTGQAIGYILDACGWPAAKRDLDLGATVIPWWWEDGDAATALEKVVRSEGPPALLTVGPDGTVMFRDRHHRLTRTAALTSQQTWVNSDPTAGVVMNKPFSYDDAWRNIINSGIAQVEVRTPGPLQEVWTSDTTITFTAGQTKLISVTGSDPFYGAIAPVAGTDYTAVTGTVTAALLEDSGSSITVKLTAVGGAAIISGLRVRARPISVAYTVQIGADNDASKADYGTRSFPGDLPWCGTGDAEAVLKTAVALRAQPLPIINVRFQIGNDPAKATVLGRDLSDRVTVVETETFVNDPFYVESISHEVTSLYDHAVTFGLEAAPNPPSPAIRLGTSGLLGAAYLSNPMTDPTSLLLLGSNTAGRRLGEGVLAA